MSDIEKNNGMSAKIELFGSLKERKKDSHR